MFTHITVLGEIGSEFLDREFVHFICERIEAELMPCFDALVVCLCRFIPQKGSDRTVDKA